MSEAIATAPLLRVEYLRVDGIRPSPFNPRKTFRGVAELAESIKSNGIKVPLRVRPIEGAEAHFELVFGERRWRAAKAADLDEVPAIIEAMTDAQARMLMLVELAQTDDVHPVEEAEVFRQLHEDDKLSVEEIAAKINKSESHVRGRIKLCDLAEPVKKAALAGELPATHALLIARVPAKLQVEALKAIIEDGTAIPYREAVALVHRKFMLALAGAPFDITDPKLVSAAGACNACPKRTGNQPELFADVKGPDVCTDTICFGKKVAAAAEVKLKAQEDSGRQVLRGGKAASLFRENYNGEKVLDHNAKLVPLKTGEQYVPDRGYVDVAAAVKKDAKIKVIAVAHPDTGEVIELVAVKALPKEKQRSASNMNDRYGAAQKTREANNKKRQDFADSLTAPIVERAEKGIGKPELAALVAALLDERSWEVGAMIERRLGKDLPHSAEIKAKDALEASLPKKSEAELRGWLAELVVMNRHSAELAWRGTPEGSLTAAAAAFGVDVAKAKKDFETALKAGKEKPAVDACAVPGCKDVQVTKYKGSSGLWCWEHGKLSPAERESIIARNQRIATEKGKPAVVYAIKKLAPAKPKLVKKSAPKAAKKKAKKK